MLEAIKLSLRISHDKLDSDIQRNIDACLLDMERVGVDTLMDDELLLKAVELYVKWQYDYQNKGKQFENNYISLRDSMSISEEYRMRG